MLARVLAAVTLLVAAAPLAAAASTHTSAAWLEAEETDPASGQVNCVEEAWKRIETTSCFFEVVTKSTYFGPRLMMRMFDLVYVTSGVPAQAADPLQEPAGTGTATSMASSTTNRGGNLHRATDGAVPDAIWPGAGYFEAWYGYWDDTEPDGVIRNRIESDRHTPDSEWVIASAPLLAAYVDPGAHPIAMNSERPRDNTPDIAFQSGTMAGYYTSKHGDVAQVGSLIIFVDGSLLQEFTVTAVTDPILVPDEDNNPFTARTDSLIDIDRHAALAEGPVANLYGATAAPVVNTIGSPSLGYCPGGCRVGPAPLGTAAAPVTHLVTDPIWARYPQEWKAGSMSTNEAHGSAYTEAYHAWIDLLPRWGIGTAEASAGARPGPLAGRAADGSQAALPGYVGFELRLGVWRDLNGDGFVGAANPDDPYEGGTRPHPDDYYNAGAEYFPTQGIDPVKKERLQNLRMFITPLDTWGPLGAFTTTSGTGTMLFVNTGSSSPVACFPVPPPNGFCMGHPLAYQLTGNEAAELVVRLDPVVPGRYAATTNLFLPEGTTHGGFLACTQDIGIEFQDAGADVTEIVRDCDVIGRLA